MNDLLTSAAELRELRKKLVGHGAAIGSKERRILVCAGASCIASGALEVKRALLAHLKEKDLSIPVVESGCLGPCASGPVIRVEPEGYFYENLAPVDTAEIVREHLIGGKPVERLAHRNTADGKTVLTVTDNDFFRDQRKIVLRNCGLIDPLNIEDYIARDGYAALEKVLTSMEPDQIIAEMKASGLRGRGGAGFPTWLKWQLTAAAEGDVKYALCNADEGDPGAFMDRSVLEGDPHSVIEGMIIAARAIGAHDGFVYVRAEYPLAVARLRKALQQARERGLLGPDILGSGFSFDLDIRMGSGAFVCGEETALMHSIEGKRGEPRPRPPFPAQKGLWGKPSLLNNVETYANVAAIILNGASWYASVGTEASKGTKVFALAGTVNNTGLVEVPIGTSLGELIYDIGGGIKNGKRFKAAQIGGPSGGCIPKEYLNVPLDYAPLQELGAIMGSGGLIVMDEESCMVDVARFFLEFVQEESCGKCVPCRVGTKRMLEIIERICAGKGQMEDIDTLIELGTQIKDTALCGLGQTAPNPVLSTLRHFRHEYEEHILQKHCDAGVCSALVRAPCQSACPAGVDVPGFVSLIAEKRYAEALTLHRERNPFAAVCARVCFHTCEDRCRRASLDDSVAIRSIKRFMVDQEVTIQHPMVWENAVNAKRKIAIVGGGPAGLSCAYFLARLGYEPQVLEAEPRPGGMLAQTIPAYRLPRETLAREIRMIEALGVEIRTDQRLGKDFSLKDLREDGYEALFLGIGAPESVSLGIPGEMSRGVVHATNFLRQYNIRGSVPVGRNVIVIGGGNAAIDAARTALRLGAEGVTVIYRRTQEQMPAYAEEIEEALHEGVALLDLTQPVEVVTGEKGVIGLACLPMQLGEFDRSGRRRATESSNGAFTLDADQIIIAIGQRLDHSVLRSDQALSLSPSRFLLADQIYGSTSVPWIFAGGDAVTGPSSVVTAIAGGERAAVGMDRYLTGEEHAYWREQKVVETNYDPDSDPVGYPRENVRSIPVERRRSNFDEVELPWCESVAVRQASRCLRCDYGKQPVVRNDHAHTEEVSHA